MCGQLSPKRQETWRAVLVAYRAWQIIEALSPTAWTIENPVGMLKNMDFMLPLPRHCVHYCQYGDTAQKPTHIWTNIRTWKSRPRCRNGDPCHVPAPRNSCTPGSTRGKRNAYERSIILCQLCEELVGAAELWLVARGRGDDLCPTPSIVEGLEPYDNERT